MNIKKSFFILVIFFLPLFLLATNVPKTQYTIGVQNFKHYLPYSQYQNKKYVGFNRELLDMFAKKMGYEFIYKAYPIKRLYKTFLNKGLDFKYPDNKYWNAKLKRLSPITYSNKVIEYIDGVMVKPKNREKGIKYLKNLSIVAGFTPFSYTRYIKNGRVKFHEEFNYKNMIIKVLAERVDGVYSNIAVTKYYLTNVAKKNEQLVFNRNLPHIRSFRHLSTIRYPKVIQEFNIFLQSNKGEIENLKRKYKIFNYLPDE